MTFACVPARRGPILYQIYAKIGRAGESCDMIFLDVILESFFRNDNICG